jgi:hypothetical protein
MKTCSSMNLQQRHLLHNINNFWGFIFHEKWGVTHGLSGRRHRRLGRGKVPGHLDMVGGINSHPLE